MADEKLYGLWMPTADPARWWMHGPTVWATHHRPVAEAQRTYLATISGYHYKVCEFREDGTPILRKRGGKEEPGEGDSDGGAV